MQVYREVNQIPVSDLVLASTSLELNEPISQGDLITETRFRQSALVTEDVVTTIIQQLRSMPDHKTITTSLYPKLVRTPAAYICVYGWNMVEEALKAQQITIRCSVRYLRQISDADLAILKVIIRFRSKDSTSYAELAANVRRLYTLLGGTAIKHGGARTEGQSIIGEKEDLIARLEMNLKEDRSTITDYLNKTEYLSDELLSALVEKEASKGIFDRLFSSRNMIKQRLQKRSMDPSDIESQISRTVSRMAEAFIEHGDKVFKATTKLIREELAPPRVTAEIRGKTEHSCESGETQCNEARGGNVQIAPSRNGPPTPPYDNEPKANPLEADEETLLISEVTDNSNCVGLPDPTVGQVKLQFANICLNTFALLLPLTETQTIQDVLQQHRIEVGRIEIELIKIHFQSAGK